MVERNGYHNFYDRQPKLPFNWVQRLHLELMRRSSFNDFDGQQVAQDLAEHPTVWRAAMLGNFGHSGGLLALRDMERGFYNADTLMLLTDAAQADALLELASHWNATEVGWLPEEDAQEALGLSHLEDRRVLRCWWDYSETVMLTTE